MSDMKQKNVLKVATDMFWMQLFWALGFLGVMLLVHIAKMVATLFREEEVSTFYASASIASNIFMLVIGIISSLGFIKHYVGHGITRKDYFYGSAFASVGLSVLIPILSAIITYVVGFVIKIAGFSIVLKGYRNEPLDESGIIGNIVQSIIMAPIIELDNDPLLALFIFSLSALTYYIAGWLIGSAFYRFGAIIGIGTIILGAAVIYIEKILINAGLGLEFFDYSFNLPLAVSAAILLVLLCIVLWLIRQFTKRIPIKL
jgi:hypothetical protein